MKSTIQKILTGVAHQSYRWDEKLTKDEILTAIVIIILLFTAMINWNVYSWLIFVAIVIILIAWYFKPGRESRREIEKR